MMASEASGLRGIPRVTLQPESDAPNIDQRHHVIACVRETGDAWEGYLVSATDGRAVEPPVFGVWPKSAWKVAEKTS